jgi:hypothetical protein
MYTPLHPSLQQRDVVSDFLRRFLQQRFKHAVNTVYEKVCSNCKNPGKHKKGCLPSSRGDQRSKVRRATFTLLRGGPEDIPEEFFPSPSAPLPSSSASSQPAPLDVPSSAAATQTNEPPEANRREVVDDDVPESTNVVLAALREYARDFIAEHIAKIPSIQNRKPKNGFEDWMSKAGISSNRFPFPEASALSNHATLKRYFLSAVSFACEEASIEVWDLEAFFHWLLPEGGLLCHCGKPLTREGLSDIFVLVRCASLAFKLLLSVRYRCVKCGNPKEGSESSTCTSLSPEVWRQLKDSELVHKLSFPLIGPKLDLGLVTMAETIVCHGGSFRSVVQASGEAIYGALLRRGMGRLRIAKRLNNPFHAVVLKGREVTAFADLFVPRAANLIEAVRIRAVGSPFDGFESEGVYQASFLAPMKEMDSFAFDQTHFGTDKIGLMAYQNALVGSGEVVLSQAQEGTSLTLSKQAFQYMDSVAPDCLGAYCDNPKSFFRLLQEVLYLCFSIYNCTHNNTCLQQCYFKR